MTNEEQDVPEEDPAPEIHKEAPEETSTEDATDPLAEAEAQIVELKDKLLRAVAETENLRRRAERERTDAANYSVTAFAREMLAVSDNLRRALDAIPDEAELGDNAKNLVEGLEMTERELLNIFERKSITKIDPKGEMFDHNFHQAVFEIPDSGEPDGTVLQVMQEGYVIKDRLLRPAMVGVAKGGTTKSNDPVDTTA